MTEVREKEAAARKEAKSRLEGMARYAVIIDLFGEQLSAEDLEEIIRCLKQVDAILRPQGLRAAKAAAK